MAKSDYLEQLKTAEWKKKRLEIFKRDGFACTVCKSKKDLQVHHKKYIKGRKAWEYPNEELKTVCGVCHGKIHRVKKIVVTSGVNNLSKADAIKKRINKLIYELSPADQELQKKYDKLNGIERKEVKPEFNPVNRKKQKIKTRLKKKNRETKVITNIPADYKVTGTAKKITRETLIGTEEKRNDGKYKQPMNHKKF